MSVRLRNQALESLPRPIRIPGYDRSAVRPGIVHFGVGGFHRSHQAVTVDDLLGQGETEWGICKVGLLPADAEMSRTMREQDDLYTVVSRTGRIRRGQGHRLDRRIPLRSRRPAGGLPSPR